MVTGVADLASPLTGWGFHQDHYGIWYENILSTPFMVGYLLYLAVILFLLVRYRRRLPTALFHMLIFTETVCGLIVVMEAAMNTTSFLATTYFLPLLVVLYMLHANAYDPWMNICASSDRPLRIPTTCACALTWISNTS